MGCLIKTGPPWPNQVLNYSSMRRYRRGEHETFMASKGGTSSCPHFTTDVTPSMYRRHGDSTQQKQWSSPPHNGAMPAMSSAHAATDAAMHLADTLVNPTPAAPFAHFGTHTIDAIRLLEYTFEVSGTHTPTPTPQPRRTCTATLSPMPHINADPLAPPRFLPAVPQIPPPGPHPEKTLRMDPSEINPPHRYIL